MTDDRFDGTTDVPDEAIDDVLDEATDAHDDRDGASGGGTDAPPSREASDDSDVPQGMVSTGWGGFESPFRSSGEIPDFRAAREHVLVEVIRFAARLRNEGVSVPITGALDAARALAVVGLSERERVASALRTTLVTDAADLEAFEALFPDFWRRLRTGIDGIAAAASADAERDGEDAGAEEGTVTTDLDPTTGPEDDESDDAADDDADEGGADPPEAEPDAPEEGPQIRTERRHASGERPTDEDEDENARQFSSAAGRSPVDAPAAALDDREVAAIERFADAIATLPGRRDRPAGPAGRVDARRAFRAALETGGAPMVLPRRDPVESERRVCLLLDVSGSVLDTVDRATLLAFAEELHGRSRRGRVFLFDDEFADVTEQFDRAAGDPAAALREAEVRWGGGTRIGAALETLRTRHPDAVDRRTVVVVVSDGLDVGEDDALRTGITWIAGRADAVVWLNPLAVASTYEPETRGMRTCLPYVDALFGFATPADLAAAASQLEQRGLAGRVGYEHDPRRYDSESAAGRDPALEIGDDG